MIRLSALLPVAVGVACYATLSKTADTARATGEPRSRGQVMADTLVERLTGHATGVPVAVKLLINTDTLLGSTGAASNGAAGEQAADTPAADEPALLTAPGLAPIPIPAGTARDLITTAPTAWLRRLFTTPATGALVALETQHRLFTPGQRDFIRYRDQYCATPWCGAPIRHADHITPAADGGPTSTDNGRGLCEACNHARQAPGWHSTTRPDGSVQTTTPTGHHYRQPPPTPLARPPADPTTPTVRDRIKNLQRLGRLAAPT